MSQVAFVLSASQWLYNDGPAKLPPGWYLLLNRNDFVFVITADKAAHLCTRSAVHRVGQMLGMTEKSDPVWHLLVPDCPLLRAAFIRPVDLVQGKQGFVCEIVHDGMRVSCRLPVTIEDVLGLNRGNPQTAGEQARLLASDSAA